MSLPIPPIFQWMPEAIVLLCPNPPLFSIILIIVKLVILNKHKKICYWTFSNQQSIIKSPTNLVTSSETQRWFNASFFSLHLWDISYNFSGIHEYFISLLIGCITKSICYFDQSNCTFYHFCHKQSARTKWVLLFIEYSNIWAKYCMIYSIGKSIQWITLTNDFRLVLALQYEVFQLCDVRKFGKIYHLVQVWELSIVPEISLKAYHRTKNPIVQQRH